jgi:hypothetical protein
MTVQTSGVTVENLAPQCCLSISHRRSAVCHKWTKLMTETMSAVTFSQIWREEYVAEVDSLLARHFRKVADLVWRRRRRRARQRARTDAYKESLQHRVNVRAGKLLVHLAQSPSSIASTRLARLLPLYLSLFRSCSINPSSKWIGVVWRIVDGFWFRWDLFTANTRQILSGLVRLIHFSNRLECIGREWGLWFTLT